MRLIEIAKKIAGHEPILFSLFDSAIEKIKHKSSPCMLELGCGDAYYSAYFREKIGSNAKNIMIEPVIEYWENYGKSYFESKSNYYFYNTYISSIVWAHWGGPNDIKALDIKSKVSEMNIETILDSSKVDFIDILHMDMQGSEYLVLKYLIDSGLINKMDYIFIMTHNFNDINYQSYLDLLNSYKDKIIFNNPKHKEFGDGLIVVKMI